MRLEISGWWKKKIDGLDNLSYLERLAYLDLYSLKGRLFSDDNCHGKSCINSEDVFVLSSNSIIRGHRFKIAHILGSLV